MRVYISGKITGTTDYMERFAKAEEYLKSQGYEVVNPAKVNANLPKSCTWNNYMTVSFALLSICDSIYMLDGYEESRGAMKEFDYADKHGYDIIYQHSVDNSVDNE